MPIRKKSFKFGVFCLFDCFVTSAMAKDVEFLLWTWFIAFSVDAGLNYKYLLVTNTADLKLTHFHYLLTPHTSYFIWGVLKVDKLNEGF